jgi:hypothetical protein
MIEHPGIQFGEASSDEEFEDLRLTVLICGLNRPSTLHRKQLQRRVGRLSSLDCLEPRRRGHRRSDVKQKISLFSEIICPILNQRTGNAHGRKADSKPSA